MRRAIVAALVAMAMSSIGQPAQAVDEFSTPVKNLSVASRAASSVTLTWTAPNYEGLAPVESYNIYFKTVTDPLWSLATNVTTTSAQVTGLAAATDYQFKVAAVNALGEGAAAIYGQALSLTAGSNHSCVVRGDGSVWCWGANDFGQFGAGDLVGANTPRRINGLTNVTHLSAASTYACAIAAGAVSCFGDNTFGQLGDGSTIASATPVSVVGIAEAVSRVDVGETTACAVTVSGALYCWGDGTNALIGDGSTNSSLVAKQVLIAAVDVSVGVSHACALMADASVSCWGSESLTPTTINVVPNALQVSVGGAVDSPSVINGFGDMCAITQARSVVCWTSITSPAIAIPGPTMTMELSVGTGHACAVTTGGAAWCWGSNTAGQLGSGSNPSGISPVTGAPALIDIAASSDPSSGHTCATTSAGSVYCWGANGAGQLGNGNTLNSVLPVVAGTFAPLTARAAAAAAAVQGLTFVSRTQSSIEVSWTGLTLAETDFIPLTHYLVETSRDGVVWKQEATTGAATSFVANGLTPASSYYIRIAGVTAAGAGAYSVPLLDRTSNVPNQVSGLQFVSRTPGAISISWTVPASDGLPILAYQVEWMTGSGSWQSAGVVGSTSYTINGLTPATTYRIRVAAASAAGFGPASAEISDRTSNTPDKVTGVSHVDRNGNSITVSWSTPTADGLPIIGYQVQWFAGLSASPSSMTLVTPATTTTINGLVGATTYRIQIAGISAAGVGTFSDEFVDRTLNPPNAVTGLMNAGRTASTISLIWTAPAADGLAVTEYVVEWATASGPWSQTTVTTPAVTLSGLSGNTDYRIRVSARSAAGLGSPSVEWIDHTLRAPAKVIGINHISRSESTIEISWQTPSSDGLPLTQIKIEWSRDGQNWPAQVLTGQSVNLTQVKLTGLQPASDYQIRITASSSVGAGVTSDIFLDRTSHAPSQVTGVTYVGRSARAVSLSWSRPDSDGIAITGYKVEASTDGMSWTSQVVPGEVTSGTISGLNPNTTYQFRVSGINAAGVGAASTIFENRTSHAPASVGAITVVARSSSSLSLTWNAPADDGSPITAYTVEYSENGVAWNSFAVQNSSALLTNLPAASSYYIRVIAANAAGAAPASESLIASTIGNRTDSVFVKDFDGKPVVGGQLTWRKADNSQAASTPVPLSAEGSFVITDQTPGLYRVSITNATLEDGSKVSGESTIWFGFVGAKVQLPATPLSGVRTILVTLPNGRAVVGARVSVSNLSSTLKVGDFTFTTDLSTTAGVTDSFGRVSVSGFASGTPVATATYFDGLTKQVVSADVVGEMTTVTLSDAAWVKSLFSTKTVQRGDRVEIQVTAQRATGVLSGIAIKLLAPKGASQTGCKAVLKGTTNALGKVKLYACATKSGQYKLSAVGAVVTSTVTLLVNGTAPMPVTRLTVASLTPRGLTIGWLAPQFNGGSKISTYKVVVVGGGKTIARTLTQSTLSLKGLTSGVTYSVSVVATSANGVSDPSTATFKVS